jgi:hypothetical protein
LLLDPGSGFPIRIRIQIHKVTESGSTTLARRDTVPNCVSGRIRGRGEYGGDGVKNVDSIVEVRMRHKQLTHAVKEIFSLLQLYRILIIKITSRILCGIGTGTVHY